MGHPDCVPDIPGIDYPTFNLKCNRSKQQTHYMYDRTQDKCLVACYGGLHGLYNRGKRHASCRDTSQP